MILQREAQKRPECSLSTPERVANTAKFLTRGESSFVLAGFQQSIGELPQTFFTVNHLALFFQQ